jgi:hypothetical protein
MRQTEVSGPLGFALVRLLPSMRRHTLQAAFVLIFLGFCMPSRAQLDPYAGAFLEVCNKGTVPVEVVVATRNEDVARGGLFGSLTGTEKFYWNIEGIPIPPQICKNVNNNREGQPAYIAFGFTDAKGVWGSGKVAQVPDLGSVGRPTLNNIFHEEKVLTAAAAKVMCARKDETEYNINDDFQTDCATLTLTGGRRAEVGHGAFFPLTSALYFYPITYKCSTSPYNYNPCTDTGYYLNIAPRPGDRDLHATPGSYSGADAEPRDPDLDDPVKALKKLRELLDAFQLKQYPACNVITEPEAEAVLGVAIDPPQPGRTLCRYQEPGYGTDASKKKQVTIGIWRSTTAAAEDVNNRRNAIIKDKSLLPVTYKEIPDFGDAAIWVWAGGYYGALYSFRGGMVEVAVKISGVPENVALSTAKKFAARALGGTGKTGFVYAPAPKNP